MKKILMILCLFIGLNCAAYAQQYSSFISSIQVKVMIDDFSQDLYLNIQTYFNEGSGEICPYLISHIIQTDQDTLKVKLYYDISGIWPQAWCMRENTFTLGQIPQNISYYNTPQKLDRWLRCKFTT